MPAPCCLVEGQEQHDRGVTSPSSQHTLESHRSAGADLLRSGGRATPRLLAQQDVCAVCVTRHTAMGADAEGLGTQPSWKDERDLSSGRVLLRVWGDQGTPGEHGNKSPLATWDFAVGTRSLEGAGLDVGL